MVGSLDCVIVGYNDIPFSSLLQRSEISRQNSGGYRHLLVNSVPFGGRRLKYSDLLNYAIEAATGTPSDLHVGRLPNLGVYYLVSTLRKRLLSAELINLFTHEKDRFVALLEEKPRSAAITTTFYSDPEPIKEIVSFIRSYSPETKIIVGGPHIFNVCSDNAPHIQDLLLQDMGADIYIFDSQGELSLANVCTALRDAHPDLSKIPNLIYKADRYQFHRTSRQIETNDMNTEAVDWSLFDPECLLPTVQTRTARSCAYKCAFCRYPIMGGPLDLASIETIEKELEYLYSVGVRSLLFIDDTFNIPLNRFKDICRMIIRKRFVFQWFSYFRCANADAEAFDLMAESGCKGVFLGIESGDDRVLKAMNKAASVDKYARGIERLKKRGIISYASFIVGHPGETEETAHNTIAFVQSNAPNFYSLETFYYDRKVPIGSRADEFGLSGQGYAWKHRTMNWRLASEIVEEGYRTIQSSVVCPLFGFDLWSIAYLLGEKLTIEQIREFLRIASMLATSEKECATTLERQLINVFRQNGREIVI